MQKLETIHELYENYFSAWNTQLLLTDKSKLVSFNLENEIKNVILSVLYKWMIYGVVTNVLKK